MPFTKDQEVTVVGIDATRFENHGWFIGADPVDNAKCVVELDDNCFTNIRLPLAKVVPGWV